MNTCFMQCFSIYINYVNVYNTGSCSNFVNVKEGLYYESGKERFNSILNFKYEFKSCSNYRNVFEGIYRLLQRPYDAVLNKIVFCY